MDSLLHYALWLCSLFNLVPYLPFPMVGKKII